MNKQSSRTLSSQPTAVLVPLSPSERAPDYQRIIIIAFQTKFLNIWNSDLALKVSDWFSENFVTCPCFNVLYIYTFFLDSFHKIKLFRSFKPDFVFIRQNLRNATEDHKNLLLGFQYGGEVNRFHYCLVSKCSSFRCS